MVKDFYRVPIELTVGCESVTIKKTGEVFSMDLSTAVLAAYLENQYYCLQKTNRRFNKSKQVIANELGISKPTLIKKLQVLADIGFCTVARGYCVGGEGQEIVVHNWDKVKKGLVFNKPDSITQETQDLLHFTAYQGTDKTPEQWVKHRRNKQKLLGVDLFTDNITVSREGFFSMEQTIGVGSNE